MSSIESLGISGIRGYSPENYQRIEFLRPLTLIWGKNGSGKTTIIECLKYITTGALPPNSDKGKSFVMDTKVAGKPEVVGDIRLIFKTGNRAILAKRRMQLSAKGNTTKFESIEQVLKTKGDKGEELTINHQCAEIEKQVPQFLGISKPILENIVFCHQDESLWPFGDSTLLKNIFDELFETKKITKEMERMWDIHKQQQTQLKQLKIRLEYEKQSHKRQLEERSKLFLELEEIKLKARSMEETKQKILEIKDQLRDTSQKASEKQKLVLKKGRLTSSVQSLEKKLKEWKESIYKVQKSYQKIQGKNSNGLMNEDSFGLGRQYNLGEQRAIPQFELDKVKMVEIDSAQKGMEELEQRKKFYSELYSKYQSVKNHYETMLAFKETTKRQQQIKSEQQRLKNLFPQLKHVKDTKTDDEFLRIVKQKLTQMEHKITGIERSKQQLRKIQIPNLVQMGFSDKEIQELKKESKQLQEEIQSSSVVILKVYKALYKPVDAGIHSLLNQSELHKGRIIQNELQSVNAILKSKEEQKRHYQTVKQSGSYVSKQNLLDKIYHYKIAGIELQDEMMHFCEEKKKCYFCSKKMTDQELDVAREKVELIKEKAQQKLNDLKAKKDDQGVDPEMMIKKLNDEIKKLTDKQRQLQSKVKNFEARKKASTDMEFNNALIKQLKKCNLSVEMLGRLTYVKQEPKPQDYYQNVSLEEYKEMSSAYQVRLMRYKGVKEQTNKIEDTMRKNELDRQTRQTAQKKKKEIETALEKANQETKGYEFLKNSCQKLESLMRMETKSKAKKGNNQSSSQNNGYSLEQAERSVKELYSNMLEEKLYIEKLQISIGHFNDSFLLKEERSRLKELESQLSRIGKDLKASEQLQNTYNQLFLQYTRQAERYRHRLSIISSAISTPLKPSYLMTLNKSRHLQASIANIQECYHLLEESVNEYHSQKMEEINRYIYQVWREIYHGEDIEYIEIEAVMDPSSKKKKKNYNYRIMMKKSTQNFGNKQEMVDMKGRCSTGQKVLASIVIRLALAEVFCSSTRILALDEPTTNLDKQHIQNLAQALLRLIELSGGKNLQLIIISHDIEFIQLLEQYAQSYYEVKRDQNRFSTIEKRMIKDIYHGK